MALLRCYICDINNDFNLIPIATNQYYFDYSNMTNGVSYYPQTIFEALCTSYSSQLSSHNTKQVVKYIYSNSPQVQLWNGGGYVNFSINNPSNLSTLYQQATSSDAYFTGASQTRFILLYIQSVSTYYYKLYKTDNSAYNGTTYGPYTMTSNSSSYFVQDLIQQSYLASVNNKYQVSQSTYPQVNFLNAEKNLITLSQNNTYYFNFFVQDTENYTTLITSQSQNYQTGNCKAFPIKMNSNDTFNFDNQTFYYQSLNSKEISVLPIYPEYNSQLLLHVNSSNNDEFAIMFINNTIYQSLQSIINEGCSSIIQFIKKLNNTNNHNIKIYFDNGAVNISSTIDGDSDWNDGKRGIGIISGDESRIKELQISVTAQTQYYILIFTQPILNGDINRFDPYIICNFISSNYFSYSVMYYESIHNNDYSSIVLDVSRLPPMEQFFTVPNDNQNNIINLNYNDSSNTYQKILSPHSFSNYFFIGYSLEYSILHYKYSKNVLSSSNQLIIDKRIPFNCQYVAITSDGFCFIPNYLYNYQNYNQYPTRKELITSDYSINSQLSAALMAIYQEYYHNEEPISLITYNYTLDSNITYYSYDKTRPIEDTLIFNKKHLIPSEFINFILNVFFPIADDGNISTSLTPITNRNFQKRLIEYSKFQTIFGTSSFWTVNRNLFNNNKVWRNGTVNSL